MSCHSFGNGIVCLPNIYKYEGFIFEFHNYLGPFKLKKDFEPAKREGRKFYNVVTKWCKLNKRQKNKTRVYG